MSDQDTSAPTVNVTIKRIEVTTGDDPDRFIHSLNKAVARELARPAYDPNTTTFSGAPSGQRIVGLYHVPWRRRIRKAAFIVVGAGVVALAVIGALSLF